MTLHGLLVGLGIAVAIWALAVGALFAFGHASTARELVGLIPNLLLLFKDLAKDPRVPRGAKWWLLVGAVWIASPIDLLPEFLPVVGPLDDAIVAAVILRHLVRSAGADVVAERWRGDPATLERILRLFGTPRA
ncbi:MAG: YkvA family protein [Planctomycetaceae bacterium]